jgi:hypothetical protein
VVASTARSAEYVTAASTRPGGLRGHLPDHAETDHDDELTGRHVGEPDTMPGHAGHVEQ